MTSLSHYSKLLHQKTDFWKRYNTAEKALKNVLLLVDDYIHSEKSRGDIVSELKNHIEVIKNSKKTERLQECIDELSALYLLIQYENKEHSLR